MADSRSVPPSLSDTEQAVNTEVVPDSVKALVQSLDDKFEKELDKFATMIAESLKRRPREDASSESHDSEAHVARRKRAKTSNCDVLIVQEDQEIDDLEECENALIRGVYGLAGKLHCVQFHSVSSTA
eukprot:GHVL01012192.1.p1 GENE.GHVL01012192.1~~GHVL01012192.1.p1  ORF type:complete len:128 (-),score=20.92 GHVL01012192.1:611-994(-)